jgi:hypothetical protein
VFVGFVSIFAYVISPDSSQYANQMHLSIHSKKPGFSVMMLTIPSDVETKQSVLEKVFFGKKSFDTEIPISNYSLENNKLTYTEYASDGLEGLTKTIDTDFINQNSAKQYIKEHTFGLEQINMVEIY